MSATPPRVESPDPQFGTNLSDRHKRNVAGDEPTRHEPPLLKTRLALMMFLQYGSLGLWTVTFGTFIGANTGGQGEGIFNDRFVGDAATSGAFGAIFAPILVGWLADRWLASERMLALLHAACAGILYAIAFRNTQAGFYLCLIAYYQCYVPTVTLSTSLSLQQLASPARHFPPVRAIGTSGWIVAGLIVGWVWPVVFGHQIESLRTPMLLGVGAHVLLALYCLTLPHTPVSRLDVGQVPPLVESGRFFRKKELVVFVALSSLACMATQFYNVLNLFLNQQQVQYAAAKQSFGQLTEVVTMLLLPAATARFGLKRLIILGLAAWAGRYVLLAGAVYPGSGWMMAPAIGLHGISYTWVYITGAMYIDRMASPRTRGVAQGIFALATLGVGHLTGALLVGWAQASLLTPAGVSPPPYDWVTFWLIPAGMMAVAIVLFAVFFSERPGAPEMPKPDAPIVPLVAEGLEP